MKEMKRFAQWLFWFDCFLCLFILTEMLGLPVILRVLGGDVPRENLPAFSWMSVFGFILGMATIVWWLGRGQCYQSMNRLAPKDWRKEFPTHCPVIMRTMAGKDVGPCWYALKDGVCPQHGRIYEGRKNHASM